MTDHEIHRRIDDQLTAQQLNLPPRVAVRVQDGMATMEGSVESFYEKQLFLHSVQRVVGVGNLVDRIAVA